MLYTVTVGDSVTNLILMFWGLCLTHLAMVCLFQYIHVHVHTVNPYSCCKYIRYTRNGYTHSNVTVVVTEVYIYSYFEIY